MYKEFGINDEIINLSKKVEEDIKPIFEKIDKVAEYNSLKVLNAFQKNCISDVHFGSTTGYGYSDIGRDTIEKVYSDIFKAEDSLVRSQFISGSHALTVALFAFLRPGDTLLSITGKPYDTLDEVIGIVDNPSSLKSFGVNFEQIDLVNDDFVGADVVVGSLIKNLGGGIAPNGAYIAGKKDLIKLAADRLTVPGEGKEVGPTLGINKSILQGLFFAPSVVASSLKTAVFASKMLDGLGYKTEPLFNEQRADIVQTIIFGNEKDLVKYCQGIQMGSPIDSNAIPEAWDMPGYTDKVIMAAGAFTQGSSIELSCDGPIRSPYIAFQQGGLTYEYGKLGVLKAIQNMKK